MAVQAAMGSDDPGSSAALFYGMGEIEMSHEPLTDEERKMLAEAEAEIDKNLAAALRALDAQDELDRLKAKQRGGHEDNRNRHR
jgi:hypothetical protein